MRILLQRVSRAEVRILSDSPDVPSRLSGRIGPGLVLLVGITHNDTASEAEWMADKVSHLRVFPDEAGTMNRAIGEFGGSLLVVSQFTLYSDTRKGRRPSYLAAASPNIAEPLYNHFIELLRKRNMTVETGEFGAMMDVELVNNGPVTLFLERTAGGPTSDSPL